MAREVTIKMPAAMGKTTDVLRTLVCGADVSGPDVEFELVEFGPAPELEAFTLSNRKARRARIAMNRGR